MPNQRVADIMIPLAAYPHIAHGSTLQQAVASMEGSILDVQGRKSLPRVILIVDDHGQLMGLLRRRDILRGLMPKFLGGEPAGRLKKLFDVRVDPSFSLLSMDALVKGLKEQAERRVAEVMVPVPATVEADDNLLQAIYLMVNADTSLLPVLEKGKVVGVVRSVDVLREVAAIVL